MSGLAEATPQSRFPAAKGRARTRALPGSAGSHTVGPRSVTWLSLSPFLHL